MQGPGDDDPSSPADTEASVDGDATQASASAEAVEAEAGEDDSPEPQLAPTRDAGSAPTKWQRPLPEQEEREPPPDVFDTSIRRSSRLHKDQVAAFAALTKDIFELSEGKRAKLGLDPEVAAAFTACEPMKKGAKVRELRRISTMLRRFDGADLRVRVDDIKHKDRAASERSKGYERWRDRLLEEGDAALSEFVVAHPHADRQLLRQLVRTASRDRTQGKSRQAFRNLLREIRALDAPTS